MNQETCPDCCVLPGNKHMDGCDMERCLHGQRIACGECQGEDHTVWSGQIAGIEVCYERGWFCQDGFGPDARWGSFCPCGPDDPDAMPDMNRVRRFEQTGKDDLYDGCPRKPRRAHRQVVKKVDVVEAVQWFENGDHPDDACEVIPDPEDPSRSKLTDGKVVGRCVAGKSCGRCGKAWSAHGWLHQAVCPGDWIVTDSKGQRTVMTPSAFMLTFVLIS